MTDTQQIDLSNYSLAELRALSVDVEHQISVSEKSMLADARRRIEQIEFQTGLTLEELVAKPRRSRLPTSVYVNPDDESQTWTGIGRKPAWLKAWLECGISLDELPRREATTALQKSAAE